MTKPTRRYEVFRALKEKPTSSIKDLCESTGIKWPSHIHALLKELELEGLIYREPYKMDTIKIIAEPAEPAPKAKKRGRKKKQKPVIFNWTIRRRQTPEQLERAIERVVRRAQERETNYDVMHDHRHAFPRHGVTARRIG